MNQTVIKDRMVCQALMVHDKPQEVYAECHQQRAVTRRKKEKSFTNVQIPKNPLRLTDQSKRYKNQQTQYKTLLFFKTKCLKAC